MATLRVLFLLVYFISFSALSKPVNIPEPLKPWQDWVMFGHEEELCPTPYNNPDEHFCVWPTSLQLIIDDKKGQFTEKGMNYSEGWVVLPGDNDHWPLETKINGKAAAIVSHDGLPAVFLPQGEYTLQGQFSWDVLPDFIQVPNNVGTLNLSILGKQIDQPSRDLDGKVWFHPKIVEEKLSEKEDSLTIDVYRLIQDEIPLIDNTHLRLRVSGQMREMNIGPVLLANALPMELQSPLPARIEENGMLRVQVKPGVWDIKIKSRFIGKPEKIAFVKNNPPWPATEIWSFEPQNELRLVEVEGGKSLDPQQTNMPTKWKAFASYLMGPGLSLKLIDKRRGQEKHPGELNVQRKLWLDFSGKGFIAQDLVSGHVNDNWRLQMAPPYTLSRATIDGQDKLITQIDDNSPPGIEIRQGIINLSAVSKVNSKPFQLPAVGWDFDVHSLSTTLYLPPGWKLLGAWGVDTVTNAWVQEWTLLDLFLVLVMSAAIAKLLGLGWGLIALVTITLIYREYGAPIYSWLNLIGALALFRVLPQGKTRTIILYYSKISFVVLVLIALPFMVKQIREAIYPQLTIPNQSHAVVMARQNQQAVLQSMAAAPVAPRAAMETLGGAGGHAKAKMKGNIFGAQDEANAPPEPLSKPLDEFDPNAKIQTGPGIPHWVWDICELQWSGPVLKDQMITLWVLPRLVTSFLKFLQVGLMFLFIYGLASLWRQIDEPKNDQGTQSRLTRSPLSLLWLLVFSASVVLSLNPQVSYADYPSKPMLEELRNRLVKAPQCMPDCAMISSMQVQANDEQLTLRLTADIAAAIAIPIPSSMGKWIPRTVLVDGVAAKGLQFEAQQLWLQLEPGVHEVILEGPMGSQDKFELFVPMKPKWVTTIANGWGIDGIYRHQLQGENIYLTRSKPSSQETQAKSFQAGRIPAFVVLTRTVKLGFDWEVVNELRREAPIQGGIRVEIPLLEGESVLTEDLEVKDGKVIVTLGENQKSRVWQSKLKITSQIKLDAIADPSIKEVWHVDALSQWHCDFEGIPIIHQQNQQGRWFPTWYPWPSESLTIKVSKPTAVAGDTLTIENSQLTVTPGKRATDNVLIFSARSSLGGTHLLHIPNEAKLQDVLINGLSQPINAKEGEISIPIHPGNQQLEVKWQLPHGLSTRYVTPLINLEMPSSNALIDLHLSQDRWILFLGGPEIGPAVLFWGLIFVVLMVSIGLGKLSMTPLSIWEWFLLGVGISVATPLAAIFIVAWFFAMYKRREAPPQLSDGWFKAMQVGLAFLTVLFIVSLFTSISNGLLGTPKMQLEVPYIENIQPIAALPNIYQLQWYQDITSNLLPQAWVISLPLYIYRVLMLLWALWLAFSLIRWMRWGWDCYSSNGLWRKSIPAEVKKE